MTPEEWRAVKGVFQDALDRPAADRAAFLARACADDTALRREVDALLAEGDASPGASAATAFFERPAAEAFSETLGAGAPVGRDLRAELAAALAGRYEVGDEVGHGGMSAVFLARDLRHGRPVAIKVLHADVAAALGSGRFLREIETAANLSHPHILALFDSGEAGGLLYYVMPYVPGGTLRDRLARDGPLPVDAALRVVGEAADALDCAHRRGVVHRDVKPENILLGEGGHVLVADFGVARALGGAGGRAAGGAPARPALTAEGAVIGTPAYMSPEQSTGYGDVTGASDQYALACVAFELLAGAPAFSGTARELLTRRFAGPLPSLAAARPDLPAAADAVLARALRADPDVRYPSATAFAEALAVALGSGVATPRAASRRASQDVGPRRRGGWAYAAALVAVLGTLGVLAAYAITSWTSRRSAPAAAEPSSVTVLPFWGQAWHQRTGRRPRAGGPVVGVRYPRRPALPRLRPARLDVRLTPARTRAARLRPAGPRAARGVVQQSIEAGHPPRAHAATAGAARGVRGTAPDAHYGVSVTGVGADDAPANDPRSW